MYDSNLSEFFMKKNNLKHIALCAICALLLFCQTLCAQESAKKTEPEQNIDTIAYDPEIVAKIAFATLPYNDESAENLTKRQLREIVKALESRITDYQNAIAQMEEKIGELLPSEVKKRSAKSSKRRSASVTNKESDTEGKSASKNDKMPIDLPDGTEADAASGILTVTSSSGSGTAFIAKIKGKLFVVTNLHVVEDGENMVLKTVDGENVEYVDSVFIAKKQDAVLIPIAKMPKSANALEMLEDVSQNAQVGDEVVACGNSLGGGVLLRSEGKILGIGPSIIETNCAIFHGNSGSPVYHKKSKKIVAIVSHGVLGAPSKVDTYSRNRSNSPIKNSLRFFNQMIDNTKDWEQMSLSDLNKQARDFANVVGKLKAINSFETSGSKIVNGTEYPDFSKIVMELTSTQRGTNAYKIALRTYNEKMAQLTKHEIAILKARKFSSAFESRVNELLEILEALHKKYEIQAKNPTLQ